MGEPHTSYEVGSHQADKGQLPDEMLFTLKCIRHSISFYYSPPHLAETRASFKLALPEGGPVSQRALSIDSAADRGHCHMVALSDPRASHFNKGGGLGEAASSHPPHPPVSGRGKVWEGPDGDCNCQSFSPRKEERAPCSRGGLTTSAYRLI